LIDTWFERAKNIRDRLYACRLPHSIANVNAFNAADFPMHSVGGRGFDRKTPRIRRSKYSMTHHSPSTCSNSMLHFNGFHSPGASVPHYTYIRVSEFCRIAAPIDARCRTRVFDARSSIILQRIGLVLDFFHVRDYIYRFEL
jgi:hypothetical protein